MRACWRRGEKANTRITRAMDSYGQNKIEYDCAVKERDERRREGKGLETLK